MSARVNYFILFIVCAISSFKLFAIDTILGKMNDQFIFRTAEPENESVLKFFLEGYIPGSAQHGSAFGQVTSVDLTLTSTLVDSASFPTPEGFAEEFPDLLDDYSRFISGAENKYTMAALLLLSYYARLNQVTLTNATVAFSWRLSGTFLVYTSSHGPFHYRVTLHPSRENGRVYATVYTSKDGGGKFEKQFYVRINNCKAESEIFNSFERDDDDDDNKDGQKKWYQRSSSSSLKGWLGRFISGNSSPGMSGKQAWPGSAGHQAALFFYLTAALTTQSKRGLLFEKQPLLN